MPNVFWILNMLGNVLIILGKLAYPYYTDVETEKDEEIFPWLILANQCQRWDSNLDLILKLVFYILPICCIYLINLHYCVSS